MKIKNIIYAILSVVITLLACKHFTHMGTSTWYIDFNKPAITPPNIVFPIVWNILYILLAISFYKILSSSSKNKNAIVLYTGQLMFQVLWCYAFFGKALMIEGLLILIVMNIYAIKMLIEFKKVDKNTYYMVLPYNIWIFFALILNASFIM